MVIRKPSSRRSRVGPAGLRPRPPGPEPGRGPIVLGLERAPRSRRAARAAQPAQVQVGGAVDQGQVVTSRALVQDDRSTLVPGRPKGPGGVEAVQPARSRHEASPGDPDRMTWSRHGRRPRRRKARDRPGRVRARVATGPRSPGSGRPGDRCRAAGSAAPAASVPARWWQVEVLPTPPFWFRAVTMDTPSALPGSEVMHRASLSAQSGHVMTRNRE